MTVNNIVPAPCQYDTGQIFRGRASGHMIDGYDRSSPLVPALDPGYVFAGWHADLIVWWTRLSATPVYICGPAGCGKTSGLKQIAARINYPVYEVTGHESLAAVDLQGMPALRAKDGATDSEWLLGPLARAMREGALFIFNEMDAASPSSLIALNTILDGSPLCIEQNGEVIRPAPGFKFAATGNSNGGGDQSGLYTGVLRQNFALLDRFICIEAEYPAREVEFALLTARAPSLPEAVRDQMLDFAVAVRRAARQDAPSDLADYNGLVPHMSTRALLRWGEVAEVYAPAAARGVNVLEKSFKLAFGNVRDIGQRQACREILQRITG